MSGGETGRDAVERYALDLDGRRYTIEYEKTGQVKCTARLLLDGEPVDEATKEMEPLPLEGGGLKARVKTDWRGRVKSIKAKAGGREVFFVPPPGTLLAKLERWERRSPVLFASRHVLLACGRILIPLLGIGALLRLLIPRIDWPDLPRIDLPEPPSLDLPDLIPDIPWPDLPDITLPPWTQALLDGAKLVAPVVIAIAVAVREVRRNRRKHAAREAARAEAGHSAEPSPERPAGIPGGIPAGERAKDAPAAAGEGAGAGEPSGAGPDGAGAEGAQLSR